MLVWRIILGWFCVVRGLAQVVVLDLPTLGLSGYYAEVGKVKASAVTGPGQGFPSGTRIEVTSPNGVFYSVGKEWNLTRGVTNSDECELTFWGRAEAGIPGKIWFKLQSKNSPAASIVERSYELDSTWRLYTSSFQAPRTLSPNDGQLVLFLGNKAQVVDMAGVRLRTSPPTPRIAGDLIPTITAIESHGGLLARTVLNTGPRGVEASRWETVSLPDNVWEAQLIAPWTQVVRAGDRMTGSCWVRLPPGETGESGMQIQFQRRDWKNVVDPWKTHAAFSFVVDHGEWRQVHFQWVVPEDMAHQLGSEAQVAVNLGFGPQVVDLAGLVLSNLGKHSGVGLLDDFVSYPGREETAAWRLEAAADIERYRKTNYTVRVRTPSGSIVGATHARARLVRHEFGFGAAVKAEILASKNSSVRDAMRGWVAHSINVAVFENDLKWGEWENPIKQARTIEALEWLVQQDIRVRGHTLVWPIDQSPAESFPSVDSLEAALKSRASAVAGHAKLKGRLMDWDVVNEPTRYGFHVDRYEGKAGLHDSGRLGPMLADCFARVRSVDQDARRVLNEFGVLEFAGGMSARDARLRLHLANLRALDAGLVQAVGLQAHFGVGGLISPKRLRAKLDEYESATGLPIVISELDVNVADESLRADYLRDVMIAAFSHRAVTDILLWAWLDGSGLEHAGMFAPDGTLRSHAIAWINLVHREWITDVVVPLDAQGVGQFRGFRGTYDLIADSMDGQVLGSGRAIPKDGILELVVPDPASPVRSEATGMTRIHNGWRLTFRVSGRGRVELQGSDGLQTPGWSSVATQSVSRDGEILFDVADPASGARFFRLVWRGP